MNLQITGHTRLGGLLGSPVAHSISPMMYNDSFRILGLDYVYLCFDVRQEQLGQVVRALRDMNVFGFNLTMPDKEAVIGYLDGLSEAASLIGAVNTVEHRDEKLIGHNTDGIGYMKAVRTAGVEVAGKGMTLLGAGGAASAIAVQAALDGVKNLHLVCRRSSSWPKAVSLVDRINTSTACKADLTDLSDRTELRKHLEDSVLLTNATSAGMSPHEDTSPITDFSVLPDSIAVSDVIYHPRETLLMREAARRGLKAFNGLYMLLYQGEAAFRIWTDREMPVEEIRASYFQ